MKKNKKTIIVICAAVVIAAVAVFGVIEIHEKSNNTSAEDINITVEPKQEATVTTSSSDDNNSNNKTAKNSKNSNKAASSSNSASNSSSGSLSGNSGSISSDSENKKPESKNVSAKEVQNKVNAYIRSKGVKVDTSMRQNTANWNGKFSGNQKDLNSGWILKNCKADVDFIVKNYDDVLSMYCYYDGNDFYVFYW